MGPAGPSSIKRLALPATSFHEVEGTRDGQGVDSVQEQAGVYANSRDEALAVEKPGILGLRYPSTELDATRPGLPFVWLALGCGTPLRCHGAVATCVAGRSGLGLPSARGCTGIRPRGGGQRHAVPDLDPCKRSAIRGWHPEARGWMRKLIRSPALSRAESIRRRIGLWAVVYRRAGGDLPCICVGTVSGASGRQKPLGRR